MNNKGFTLIELLVTITIMGLLMAIAVPNVTSMVDKNKRTAYIEDAKKMITLAKYKFESDLTNRPALGECKKYSITILDRSDLQNPPYDGKYIENYSFVTVKYNGMTYEYRVQLVEEFNSNKTTYYRGVKLSESTTLYKENTKITTVTDSYTTLGSSTFKHYNNAC